MNFEYGCVDISGKELKGTLSAINPDDAMSRLRGMGLTIIDLTEKKGLLEKRPFGKKRITDTDLYNLSKELSVLLNAGINIDHALDIILGSTSKTSLKDTLAQILRDIKGGKTLSQAFADTQKFNPLINVMITVGESVGDIRAAFENIAQYIHFQIQFKNEIRNAMAYPIFLVFASIVILFAIFKLIIPRFFSIFGQETASLPFVSRVLYSISNFINSTNIFFFLLGIGLIGISLRYMNLKKILQGVYSYLVYIPFLKNLIIHLELSKFSYSMYTMLKSGVEFINALILSKDVIQNTMMKVEIERTEQQIKEGKGIADVFSYVSFMPPMMHSMLRVGETSGNLRDIFFELYMVFDERFRNSMRRILALVEPIVITIMGVVVGIIVISLILTVMSVSNIKL